MSENTKNDFAPYEGATGETLDVLGGVVFVRRLSGEMDEPYRDRIRAAHRVRTQARRPSSQLESVVMPAPEFARAMRASIHPEVDDDQTEPGTDPKDRTLIGLVPEPSTGMRLRAMEKEVANAMGEVAHLRARELELRKRIVEMANAARYGDLELVIRISERG